MKVAGVDGINMVPVLPKESTNRESMNWQVEKQEPVVQEGEVSDQQVPVGEKELIKAIEKANKAIIGPDIMFKFSIHEGTKQIMVKVINEETGEIIREIPPEKILNMVAKMWELAGIIVDEKV